MTKPYSLPYGKGQISFDLPEHLEVTVIRPRAVPAAVDELAEIERALDQPIGGPRLREINPGQSASIVVSDLTRPVPHRLILPPLLKRLEALGISRSSVKIFIASGQHPKLTPEQFDRLVDPAWARGLSIVPHDPAENLVRIGTTARGTPVSVNRAFWESGLKIITGMIDPHQFVGFTGGSKMAAIGLGGIETIRANHAMLSHPDARMGEVGGNPVREDIDEMGGMLGIDLILNVVLNEENRVVKAFAGHYLEAWTEGVRLCRSLVETTVRGRMDLVIASQGGDPKDIDLYQVQKGLAHATRVLKPGGSVVLAGKCTEGVGDDVFQKTMEEAKSPGEVISFFESTGFRMGVHKAFLLCRSLLEHKVYLCSDLPPSLVEKFFLTPVPNLDQGIAEALGHLPSGAGVAIMPKASSTFASAGPKG